MDGHTFRVATVIFSQRRINTSKKHEIRLIAHRMLSERIPKMTVDQFAQEATMGKLASDVLAEAKRITAIRHLGIKKTKLISTPESRAVDEAKPVEVATPGV
jgi:small subunit ribosomal protein S3Ae